jgi:hypothetical protein
MTSKLSIALSLLILASGVMVQTYRLNVERQANIQLAKDYREVTGFFNDANQTAMNCINHPEEFGK